MRTLSLRKADHVARDRSLTIELKNAVGSGNHLRKLLEERVLRSDVGDTHKEVFEALNIDIHNLRNEIGDLVLLKTILVNNKSIRMHKTYKISTDHLDLEGVQDGFSPDKTWIHKIISQLNCDDSAKAEE